MMPRRKFRGPHFSPNYRDQRVPPPPPPHDRSRELVDAECPRCSESLTVRPRYNVAICPRCGWLLKIEPYWGTVSIDDVAKVAEPSVENVGQKVYVQAFREACLQVLMNWRKRNICYLEVESAPQGGKHVRVRFRDQSDLLLDELERMNFGARELKPGDPDTGKEGN